MRFNALFMAMLLVLSACDSKDLQAPKPPAITKADRDKLLAKTLESHSAQINDIVYEITGRTNGVTKLTSAGRLQETGFPDGAKLVFEAGLPKEFVDAEGRKTRWEFDSQDHLKRKIYPDGTFEEATQEKRLSVSIRDRTGK
jgi:YD repeat-containing protein